ncbi:hypothetical protein SEA_ODYSSEY395_56 [Arthrobacter phage Odyssey395]|nr:hypothetical protein SEA_ODYSSEY395_56 [Arthrobacter phage Odyssey395]
MSGRALTVMIPIKGTVLVRMEGGGEYEVGTFEQNMPLKFHAGDGEVSFEWTEAIMDVIRGSGS